VHQHHVGLAAAVDSLTLQKSNIHEKRGSNEKWKASEDNEGGTVSCARVMGFVA
jgi:hypothetical protein